jgi:hypothetical protein
MPLLLLLTCTYLRNLNGLCKAVLSGSHFSLPLRSEEIGELGLIELEPPSVEVWLLEIIGTREVSEMV